MLIACWNEFFSNIHGWFLREEQRKRNFQANEVSKRRSKKLFFTLFCALNQIFLQFPLGIVQKHAKKKQVCRWLKNKEPGERIVRFWTLILMFIFHEKCQSLGHVKMQKNALQHPIIFGVLASPWTTLKTEKRKFACPLLFMGNEKCPWTP